MIEHKWFRFVVLVLSLVLMAPILAACGGEKEEASGHTPVSIPGIDEPLIIRYASSDIRFSVFTAYTIESPISYKEEPKRVDDASKTFVEVEVRGDFPMMLAMKGDLFLEFLANNSILSSATGQYDLTSIGMKEYTDEQNGREGIAFLLGFSVPRESGYTQYSLQLTGVQAIPLERFFN